jgi:hypothetical protein
MIIKTKEPINLIGIGELPAGACVSFYANFLPREKGIICHSEWYSTQENCDKGNILFAPIAELKQKDNIVLSYTEFTPAQLEIMVQATAIVQDKVMHKLNERMNVDSEITINYLQLV